MTREGGSGISLCKDGGEAPIICLFGLTYCFRFEGSLLTLPGRPRGKSVLTVLSKIRIRDLDGFHREVWLDDRTARMEKEIPYKK